MRIAVIAVVLGERKVIWVPIGGTGQIEKGTGQIESLQPVFLIDD